MRGRKRGKTHWYQKEKSDFIEGKTLIHPTVGAEQWTEVFLLDRPADTGAIGYTCPSWMLRED